MLTRWKFRICRKFDDPTVLKPGIHVSIMLYFIGIELFFRSFHANDYNCTRNERRTGGYVYFLSLRPRPGTNLLYIGKVKYEDMGEFDVEAYRRNPKKSEGAPEIEYLSLED